MNRLSQTFARGVERVTGSALGPHQSAVIRIGFAGTWLLFLLREFPHRQELYGPAGPWSWNLARQLI
ncbi:HTTM domain-containing protein, partial [Streptomyces eurythermus]